MLHQFDRVKTEDVGKIYRYDKEIMMKTLYLIAVGLMLVLSGCACTGTTSSSWFADDSLKHAQKGKLALSAFQCSTYSKYMDKPKEQERLFKLGYKAGIDFLKAFKANKIKEEDLKNNVPLVGVMLLQGPSEDFILGRMFEYMTGVATDDIFGTAEKHNSDEFSKMIAEDKFRKENCKFLEMGS